ncbi:hypothetical protein H6F95_03535 [Cyanobacteria bacterium FACHB-471]|nr:hypothetical protein [Cyanobacteria bacterium FACHB-471]
MTTSPAIPAYVPETTPSHGRWLRYLLIGLAANALLWGLAFAYLKMAKPDYASKWAIALPSAGTTTRVALPDIGDTTSEIRSPYNNPDIQDPRENYKFILTSSAVIEAAAEKIGLTRGEFGTPEVQIVDNTTLISVTMEGDSPEQAQRKAQALYESLEESLSQLRIQEVSQKNAGVQTALANAQAKLELAQNELSAFKAESGLSSNMQIDQISTNLEELRRERAMIAAQQQQSNARLGQLSRNLNVSPRQAADAFSLSADQLFQRNLLNYSEASAALSVLSNQFGPNHPMIVRERTRQEAARTAMLQRGSTVLGRPVDQTTLAQLNLGEGEQRSSARENLFQETVSAQVDSQGLSAQAAELDRQIAQLEGRLRQMTQYGSRLEALSRDVAIAEAVFSSTITRLDLSQSDIYGSYPQVQLINQPSLPASAASPRSSLILLGTAAGSLLISMAIIALWLRPRRPLADATVAAAGQPSQPLAPQPYIDIETLRALLAPKPHELNGSAKHESAPEVSIVNAEDK